MPRRSLDGSVYRAARWIACGSIDSLQECVERSCQVACIGTSATTRSACVRSMDQESHRRLAQQSVWIHLTDLRAAFEFVAGSLWYVSCKFVLFLADSLRRPV